MIARWLHERAIYRRQRDALLAALIPEIAEFDLTSFWRTFEREAPPQLALAIDAAVGLLAVAPPFVLRRFQTAAGLERRERTELLSRCAASSLVPVRQLVTAFKLVGCFAYLGRPELRRAMMPEEPTRW